jgi:anti-sigma factor RsiW
MICCREVAQLLIDYVADELPEDQHRLVNQHLHDCPPCLAYLESYQRTIRLTRKLPTPCLPPELKDRLMVALVQMHSRPSGPSSA